MSCNCGRIIKKEITAGDTFAITYKHKQNNVIADMPEAYDLVIGLRRENGMAIASYSYQDGEIKHEEGTGIYRWQISHEVSKSLNSDPTKKQIEVVIVEMTVYSADYSFVQHCNESIQLFVAPSYMNDVIDNG